MKKVVICLNVVLVIFISITLFIFRINNVTVKLKGNKKVSINVGSIYEDPGFEVTSFNKIIPSDKYNYKENNNIDYNKIGKYIVNYEITYKRKKYKLERIVEVIDNIKPKLNINLDIIERDYCTKQNKYNLEYSATDNYDGDITDRITIKEESDNMILSVSDSSGNEDNVSIPIKYTEKPKPIFKLNGENKIYVVLNGTYEEKGAVYQDGCGNKINQNINITGNVDTNNLGKYTITYSLNDSLSLTREVNVYNPSASEYKDYNGEKIIYLTFDDGPGMYTEKVLNILAKYNIKATFFVTHQFNNYVHLIKNEYDAGHAVGVHTYTHKWDVYDSLDAYINDFNKMNDVIEQYTGSKTKIFRFPGGASNTISKSYATGVVSAIASQMTNDGYVYFDWNVDSNDAAGASKSKIYNNVVNGVKKCTNCVVLMHDIKSNTVNELDNILSTLTSKGYKFGTLSVDSPTCHHKIAN